VLLRHFYGLDLADLFRHGGGPHGLTPRRVGTLLRHLPDLPDQPTPREESP